MFAVCELARQKMKILVSLPYIPYPLNTGGNQAVFTMLDAMRKEHKLTLAIRSKPCKDSRDLEKALPGVNIIMLPIRSRLEFPRLGFKGLRFRLIRYIASSFTRKYLRYINKHSADDLLSPQTGRRRSPRFIGKNAPPMDDSLYFETVAQIAVDGHYDLVQGEFYQNVPLAYYIPKDIKTVFVHHEIMFERLVNEISLFPDASVSDEMLADNERASEVAMLSHFDHIITLTQTDKDRLQELLPSSSIFVSPAIIKYHSFMDFTPCTNQLVFLGSPSHHPNLDGMLWFCKEILPLLRDKVAGLKVHCIGKWDDVSSQLKAQYPELEFPGFIEETASFMNGKISIIPIRIGGGMRMKMLDSIQAGCPVVGTSKGIEGQDFASGKDCLIADSAEDFAASVLRLLEDPALQRQLAENAATTLKALYNPQKMIQRRLEVYRSIARSLG